MYKLNNFLLEKDIRHYWCYFLGISIFYVVNFYRVNGTGAQWYFANGLLYLVMFVFAFIRMEERPKFFPTCVIWFILSLSVSAFVFYKFAPRTDYRYGFGLRLVVLSLVSYIIIYSIRLIMRQGVEEWFPGNFHSILWFGFITVCLFSKNESIWPLLYLIIGGSFIFTKLDSREIVLFYRAVTDSCIFNFFLYQGHAFLFCPYDQERYCSFFSNSDCSAKFFTVSYIAFLSKYFILKRKNGKKPFRFFCFVAAASMWGFLFFTGTKSGFIGMGISSISFIILEIRYLHVKNSWLGKQILVFLLLIILNIPLVYAGIRYIPALRHHPVFIGAYSEERVHSWDPIDSDKYISFSEVLSFYHYNNNFKICKDVSKDYSEDYEVVSESENEESLVDCEVVNGSENEESLVDCEVVNGSENENRIVDVDETNPISTQNIISCILFDDGEQVVRYSDGVEPGSDSEHPIYIKTTYNNSFERFLGIRKYIYKVFFLNAGWFGNEEEYPSFCIISDVAYTSAHNSMLDIMIRYGYLAGILFVLCQFSLLGKSYCLLKNELVPCEIVFVVLLASAFIGWSVFYSVVFEGEIMDTLFWVSFVGVLNGGIKETKGSE